MTATEPTSNNHGGRPVFDQDRAERAIRELLLACGEAPDRDGLQDTPARVARAYREMFAGLSADPDELLTRTFDESHEELVLVTGIPMYSTSGPAGQTVDAIAGAKSAEDVVVGDRLRTPAGVRVAETTVVAIGSHRTSALVEVNLIRSTR
ncbi:GTP cyclohydrolase I [Amycolatopsis sulphurea]|uniref:GTP cyclohydrolase 1 n=1 Tax=Amycolatopsis sulphurea TaxID=76022 RepID=A0A2A9FEH6_9PSEU|nr:GTP cyclohydrolase I [Amycolatopsis sulphurea]